jgi:hypothetical protein
MTEDELRALVREVVASRSALQPSSPPRPSASHAKLGMVVPTVAGSPCLIEPNVGCNQCGYCVSMGH